LAEKIHAELKHPGMPASLMALIERAGGPAKPRPVESWDPPDCGPIDIRIDAEGNWHHLGTPIGRQALVRLFASVLRREPDGGYALVTPVEKLSIRVDDVPFIAVEMAAEETGWAQTLTFRTNVGDVVAAGPDHPLRFALASGNDGLKPYLRVRGGLEARLSRPLLYQLVDRAIEHGGGLGIVSGGAFFEMPNPGGES
jgi:hypothetical protein